MNTTYLKSIKLRIVAILTAMIMCIIPIASFASVIFSENFDSVSVPWQCNSATLNPPDSKWTSLSSCQSATYNGVTHYSMEITSGSGRSGNGMQVYRKNDFPPARDTYSMLNFDGFSGSQRDITIGWYMKIPTGIAVSSMDYIKILRGNMTDNEFYLNFNAGGGSWSTSAKMQFLANSSTWYTLLTNSELMALQDNQWHYYQVRMSLSSAGQSNGILAFWVDGAQHNISDWDGSNPQSSKTNVNYGTSSSSAFTHFAYGIGNRDDAATYQPSWQAFNFDDIIIATTKAETDQSGSGGSGSSDTTPPVISSPSPSGMLSYGTTSTSMTVTTNENATCKYGTSDVAYTSLPNTFGTTGTTNHSQTISGLTNGGSYTYYVRCIDSSSNADTSSTAISFSVSNTASSSANILLSEDFEDTNFSSRGWYDSSSTSGAITTSQYQSGTHAYVCSFLSGGQGCNAGNPGRHLFTATDTLYVDYYIKFDTGWRGSQQTYHPHMFYFLSDADGDWDGPANNYLSTYIEFLSDVGSPYTINPLIALQDEKNVNTSYGTLPNNLSSTTENRSVNYCNTPVFSGATGTCYADNPYYSANTWKASSAPVSTNAWHHVQAYFKMNTISSGKGQNNGIMQMWIDGTQVINRADVLYRTNQHANLKWHQFILGPYIGDGSPIAQRFYIDNLKIYDGIPTTSSSPVSSTLTIKSYTK